MWYKVTELTSKGFNKSQISLNLGIDRATVRKYLSFSETDFHQWVSKAQRRPKKLEEYYTKIKQWLEAHPYLSASQIEDWLKEHYPDSPDVSSKTVYNFVQSIRLEHDIKKVVSKSPRVYEKLPEVPYGSEAQVDFGSYNMQTSEGLRRKVYFFVLILSRSRQKYLYFQDKPFTSATTIEAHERGFRYLGGQPHHILYDQDRVLMRDENLGDLLLVKQFKDYISGMAFKPVFCRKADPESKGKVENVVGYVKKNFLRGRTYTNQESLNEAALLWLTRTGNGKAHAGTQKIPHDEWLIERAYLHPYHEQERQGERELLSYKVRKDNTINYKSNFYSLPLGTYKGQSSSVLIKVKDEALFILSDDEKQSVLATHTLCPGRGESVRNTDHKREKSQSLESLYAEVEALYAHLASGKEYIEQIKLTKARYFRDNLQRLKTGIVGIDTPHLEEAIQICMQNSQFNANTLIEAALNYQKNEQKLNNAIKPAIAVSSFRVEKTHYTPGKSKISTYEKIMQ